MVPNDTSIIFQILDFVRRDGNQFNLMGFTFSLEIRNFDTGEPILLFLESLLKLVIFIEVVVHQGPIIPRSQSSDTFLVWKHVLSAIGLNLLDQPTDTLLMFVLEKRSELSRILSLLPKPSTSIFLFFIAINLLSLLFLITLISILLPRLPFRRLLDPLNGVPILIQTRLLQDHFSELGDWVPGPLFKHFLKRIVYDLLKVFMVLLDFFVRHSWGFRCEVASVALHIFMFLFFEFKKLIII